MPDEDVHAAAGSRRIAAEVHAFRVRTDHGQRLELRLRSSGSVLLRFSSRTIDLPRGVERERRWSGMFTARSASSTSTYGCSKSPATIFISRCAARRGRSAPRHAAVLDLFVELQKRVPSGSSMSTPALSDCTAASAEIDCDFLAAHELLDAEVVGDHGALGSPTRVAARLRAAIYPVDSHCTQSRTDCGCWIPMGVKHLHHFAHCHTGLGRHGITPDQ